MSKSRGLTKATDLANEEIRMRLNNMYDAENDEGVNNNDNHELILNDNESTKPKKFNINFNKAIFNKNFLKENSSYEIYSNKHNYKPLPMQENEPVMNFGDLNINEPPVDDLSIMAQIDEKILLNVLKNKFESGKCYSYIDELLVSINPRENLNIYNEDEMNKYAKNRIRSKQEPHLFWTCNNTYRTAIEKQANHMMVFKGESGSGKTESFKHSVRFLTHVSNKKNELLRLKIDQSLFILEAFGHAPTLFNNNSTRFAKCIDLRFTRNGELIDAHIEEFMLEKSRVTLEFPHERNFLIFYYLLAEIGRAHV